MSFCTCGSDADYAVCCEPIITGAQPARTAEQLMRARYSAYAGLRMDFIFESTHPDHRDTFDPVGTRAWAEQSTWQGLEIIGVTKGGEEESEGEVEFIARYKEKELNREHHERGQFRKLDGTWYFAEAIMVKNKPLVVAKIGRNDPCPCGSGLKHKKCCGK
jgi:SEC-C motif domain protein